MASTNGVATTILDLIDAIRVFAVANGWTNNHHGSDGAGARLHLSKDGCFMNLRACVNETFVGNTEVFNPSNAYGLWVNPSTGFTGSGTAWYKQAGAMKEVSSGVDKYFYQGIAGNNTAVNYWLFAFANAFYVVVENPAGIFHWLGFGNLQKIGDWVGGQFLFAKHFRSGTTSTVTMPFSSPNISGAGSALLVILVNSFDTFSGWVRSDQNQNSGNVVPLRCNDDVQLKRVLWEVAPNLATGKPILLPVSAVIYRDTTFYALVPLSIVGSFQELNFLNFQGLLPAAEYDDGTGALYRIFPFHQKQDLIALATSQTGTLGFAIKSN